MNYIYIATNNKQEVKIGVTKNIDKRMKQLSGTNTLNIFYCIFYYKTPLAYDIESHIHQELSKKFKKNKEFFDIDPKQSIIEVKNIISEFETKRKDTIYTLRTNEAMKSFEDGLLDDDLFIIEELD